MHPCQTPEYAAVLATAGLTVEQVEAFEYELARCHRTLGVLELLGGRDDAAAAEVHAVTVRFGELLAGRLSQ
jgi:hypothetical protein